MNKRSGTNHAGSPIQTFLDLWAAFVIKSHLVKSVFSINIKVLGDYCAVVFRHYCFEVYKNNLR